MTVKIGIPKRRHYKSQTPNGIFQLADEETRAEPEESPIKHVEHYYSYDFETTGLHGDVEPTEFGGKLISRVWLKDRPEPLWIESEQDVKRLKARLGGTLPRHVGELCREDHYFGLPAGEIEQGAQDTTGLKILEADMPFPDPVSGEQGYKKRVLTKILKRADMPALFEWQDMRFAVPPALSGKLSRLYDYEKNDPQLVYDKIKDAFATIDYDPKRHVYEMKDGNGRLIAPLMRVHALGNSKRLYYGEIPGEKDGKPYLFQDPKEFAQQMFTLFEGLERLKPHHSEPEDIRQLRIVTQNGFYDRGVLERLYDRYNTGLSPQWEQAKEQMVPMPNVIHDQSINCDLMIAYPKFGSRTLDALCREYGIEDYANNRETHSALDDVRLTLDVMKKMWMREFDDSRPFPTLIENFAQLPGLKTVHDLGNTRTIELQFQPSITPPSLSLPEPPVVEGSEEDLGDWMQPYQEAPPQENKPRKRRTLGELPPLPLSDHSKWLQEFIEMKLWKAEDFNHRLDDQSHNYRIRAPRRGVPLTQAGGFPRTPQQLEAALAREEQLGVSQFAHEVLDARKVIPQFSPHTQLWEERGDADDNRDPSGNVLPEIMLGDSKVFFRNVERYRWQRRVRPDAHRDRIDSEIRSMEVLLDAAVGEVIKRLEEKKLDTPTFIAQFLEETQHLFDQGKLPNIREHDLENAISHYIAKTRPEVPTQTFTWWSAQFRAIEALSRQKPLTYVGPERSRPPYLFTGKVLFALNEARKLNEDTGEVKFKNVVKIKPSLLPANINYLLSLSGDSASVENIAGQQELINSLCLLERLSDAFAFEKIHLSGTQLTFETRNPSVMREFARPNPPLEATHTIERHGQMKVTLDRRYLDLEYLMAIHDLAVRPAVKDGASVMHDISMEGNKVSFTTDNRVFADFCAANLQHYCMRGEELLSCHVDANTQKITMERNPKQKYQLTNLANVARVIDALTALGFDIQVLRGKKDKKRILIDPAHHEAADPKLEKLRTLFQGLNVSHTAWEHSRESNPECFTVPSRRRKHKGLTNPPLVLDLALVEQRDGLNAVMRLLRPMLREKFGEEIAIEPEPTGVGIG